MWGEGEGGGVCACVCVCVITNFTVADIMLRKLSHGVLFVTRCVWGGCRVKGVCVCVMHAYM